jgi:hypothetical protein
MKKVLVALMTVATIGSAHAWGPREQGALAGIVIGTILSQPRPVYAPHPQVIYAPQPQVIYQQTYPQVYEYRTPPVYSPQYQPPSVSCIPAYDQFGRYLRHIC